MIYESSPSAARSRTTQQTGNTGPTRTGGGSCAPPSALPRCPPPGARASPLELVPLCSSMAMEQACATTRVATTCAHRQRRPGGGSRAPPPAPPRRPSPPSLGARVVPLRRRPLTGDGADEEQRVRGRASSREQLGREQRWGPRGMGGWRGRRALHRCRAWGLGYLPR